jgi:hypothetical protein
VNRKSSFGNITAVHKGSVEIKMAVYNGCIYFFMAQGRRERGTRGLRRKKEGVDFIQVTDRSFSGYFVF